MAGKHRLKDCINPRHPSPSVNIFIFLPHGRRPGMSLTRPTFAATMYADSALELIISVPPTSVAARARSEPILYWTLHSGTNLIRTSLTSHQPHRQSSATTPALAHRIHRQCFNRGRTCVTGEEGDASEDMLRYIPPRSSSNRLRQGDRRALTQLYSHDLHGPSYSAETYLGRELSHSHLHITLRWGTSISWWGPMVPSN